MSLTNALSSSVSGLAAASTQISVIGDNIANANTPGFKEKRAEFTAVLGQNITAGAGFAQIGAGVRVNDVGMIFSQGVFEQTQRGTDLGIEGRGFFIVDGNLGRAYTRSGAFGFDAAATDSRDPMLLVTLDLAEPLPVALAIQGLPVEVRFPRF